jgi:hypothetical protein
MAVSQSTRSNSVTMDRPPCPKCGSLMWMVRIQAVGPGVDKRAFECPVCDISETAVVKFT